MLREIIVAIVLLVMLLGCAPKKLIVTKIKITDAKPANNK